MSLQAETAQPLRPAFGDSTPDYVRSVYAMLLRREPEQPALRAFVSQVEAGRTSRLGVFRSVLASEEFRQRPARVLVVADHPFVNAATLGYRAEAARLRLAFVNGTSVPTSAGADLFDAVVVRVGGPKEWLLAAATAWVRELESPGSRFEPLPGSFEAPDASELHVFVARPEAG